MTLRYLESWSWEGQVQWSPARQASADTHTGATSWNLSDWTLGNGEPTGLQEACPDSGNHNQSYDVGTRKLGTYFSIGGE